MVMVQITSIIVMRKVIDSIAVLSLVLNIGIISTGTFIYFQKDKILNKVLDNVSNQLPSLIKKSMPLPSSTGLPIRL